MGQDRDGQRVLIAGCGYVGTALGLKLAASGHTVWGLRRRPSELPPGIRPLQGDLLDPGLRDALPRVDAVVYAASADARSQEAYRRAYVDGVENLVRILSARPHLPQRFIFVSSTAVYGDAAGQEVDEETPPAPENFRGERVLEGEARVLGALEGGRVLRLGGIYGPGRTRLLDRIRAGEARCPGQGPVWSNRIHRDDAAGALAHLLTRESLEHRVYLGVDDEPAPLCQVYRFLAELLDAPEPVVDPEVGRTRSNKRCSNRRLREAGYRFAYPTYREGYRALVESGA